MHMLEEVQKAAAGLTPWGDGRSMQPNVTHVTLNVALNNPITVALNVAQNSRSRAFR